MDPNRTNEDNLNQIGVKSNYYTTDEFNLKFNNLQNQLSLLHLDSRSLNKNFVPQGSILGPLLFLLYVNDISNASSLLSFILFADDTNIFYSHPDINSLIHTLNAELPKVSMWFRCNKLSLNLQKTNYIHFKSRNFHNVLPFDIKTDELPLDNKTHTKFLGITIDEHLSWNEHIRYYNIHLKRSWYNKLKHSR